MVNPSPSCPGARGYPLAQEASIRYARACSVRGPCAGIFTGRVIRGRTFAGAHNLRSSLYEVPLSGRWTVSKVPKEGQPAGTVLG